MLGEEIELRLNLLLDSKQISKLTYDTIKEVLKEMVEQSKLDVTSESSGQFANHLAIAAERINNKEPIEEITDQTKEIINHNPKLFEEAKEILRKCITAEGAYYTDAEAGFITLYLTMFESIQN